MIWRAVFLLAGFAVIGVEVWGTFEFLMADQHSVNYIVAGGCLITGLSGILPAAAAKAWEDWRPILAAVAWLLVPLSLVLVFMAAISRTGGAADRAQEARIQSERAYKAASEAVEELKATLRRQEATAEFECSPSQKGRGLKCADANRDVADTQAKLATARGILVKAPAVQVDSLSVRIAALTGGRVTAEQARMFQPAILPIIMSLVGAVLVAIGARSPRKPKPGKSAENKTQPAEKEKIEQQPVIETKPPVVDTVPAPKVASAPMQKNVVPIAKQKPIQVGSVALFFAARCEPVEGVETPVSDLLAAYREWCKSRDAQPVATAVFLQQLEIVAGKIGIHIGATPAGPACENVKIVA